MIYSVKQQKYVPVNVQKKVLKRFTRYLVNEESKLAENIGYVDLEDSKNGVMVLYIKNQQPNSYRHFGMVAEGINIYLQHILDNAKKGERIYTGFLGAQKMYMPINLINELMEKIKINPLLKRIK